MEYGPAGNLRQTPSRMASLGERKLNKHENEDMYAIKTPKVPKRKKSSEKKKKRASVKGRKGSQEQPSIQKFLEKAVSKSTTKSLLPQFEQIAKEEQNTLQFVKQTVKERIGHSEEGYITDPEVELRQLKHALYTSKTCIRLQATQAIHDGNAVVSEPSQAEPNCVLLQHSTDAQEQTVYTEGQKTVSVNSATVETTQQDKENNCQDILQRKGGDVPTYRANN